MMDRTIPWIGLTMSIESLEKLPVFELPGTYGWRCFRAGDEEAWAEIETSAGEFASKRDALLGFRKYYPTDEQLDERMFFLTDDSIPFATATAWFGEDDCRSAGRLHWVGIDLEHQRRMLSYPLVSLAMQRLRELGHTAVYLTTQTSSWPAIKVYHRFGFVPKIQTMAERTGWQLVSEKSGIDFSRYL